MFQPVEVSRVAEAAGDDGRLVVVAVGPAGESGQAVQGQEALAGEVVEAQHVVVEHGEVQHRVRVPALGGAGGTDIRSHLIINTVVVISRHWRTYNSKHSSNTGLSVFFCTFVVCSAQLKMECGSISTTTKGSLKPVYIQIKHS